MKTPRPTSQPFDQNQDPLATEVQSLIAEVKSLRKRVLTLEANDRLRHANRAPRMPIQFLAQHDEDAVLLTLLGDSPDGLIIEVGAFDGKSLSVSYALDAMGWDCLLIEAIPERHAQCLANRPHARVVHAALSHPNAKPSMKFTITPDPFGGMLSFLTTDASHLAAVRDLMDNSKTVTVPVTTMDALLESETRAIAAASIDVEGGEVDLLKGFDLRKHRPRVLLIEDNNGDAPSTPIARYMSTQDYTLVGIIGVNRLYIRSDLPDLIARAQNL